METGPTVVVGIVQYQHDGWSWSFRSWRTMCGDSSGCSSTGGCGASSCGGGGRSGCSGRDFSDSNRFSHSVIHGFQDHFSSSVLWLVFCDVMDCVRFGWMVCEGGEEVGSQARWLNKSEIHKARFHSKYSRWLNKIRQSWGWVVTSCFLSLLVLVIFDQYHPVLVQTHYQLQMDF